MLQFVRKVVCRVESTNLIKMKKSHVGNWIANDFVCAHVEIELLDFIIHGFKINFLSNFKHGLFDINWQLSLEVLTVILQVEHNIPGLAGDQGALLPLPGQPGVTITINHENKIKEGEVHQRSKTKK